MFFLFGVAAFANMVCVMGGRETPYMRDHLWILLPYFSVSMRNHLWILLPYFSVSMRDHLWILLLYFSVSLWEASMNIALFSVLTISGYCPTFLFFYQNHWWFEWYHICSVPTVFDYYKCFLFLNENHSWLFWYLYIYIVWYWPWQISMNIYLIFVTFGTPPHYLSL